MILLYLLKCLIREWVTNDGTKVLFHAKVVLNAFITSVHSILCF